MTTSTVCASTGVTGKALARMVVAATCALTLAGCATGAKAAGPEEYPAEKLEMAIPGGPGGGNDLMMRELAQILKAEDIYPERIDLSNRLQAGGGTTAWRDLHADAGNPYHMLGLASSCRHPR